MALHAHMLIYCDSKHIEIIKEWINDYTSTEFFKFSRDDIESTSVKFSQGRCESSSNNSVDKGIAKYIQKHVFHCINSPAYNPTLAKNNPKRFSSLQLNNEKIEAHADKFNYRRIGFFGVDNSLTLFQKVKRLVYNEVKSKAPSLLFNTLYSMAKHNKFKDFLIGSYQKVTHLLYKQKQTNNYSDIYKKVIGIHIDGFDYLI